MDYLGPLKSGLKLRILLSLLKGEKKLSEIHADVESSESTILHLIKEFEGLSLTTKSGGTYRLTSLGLLEAEMCKDASSTAKVIEKFKEFWLTHDVTALPPNLRQKIGALEDSTLIHAEMLELDNVYNSFLKLLMTSTKVKGISPIFHKDYVPVIEEILKQGKSVELIVTSGVLSKTLASANVDQLQKSFGEGTLRIFLKENLKVALTVTDTNFSLGLFNNNGEYDDNMDIVSLSREAIEWGEELYQYYLKTSTKIGPSIFV
jgi:predicted transcriptional regulator